MSAAIAGASILPKIDGFSPLPIAIMIPFMEAQSAALARAFGINYEIGKRTIKSMSNEQFNALTENQVNSMLRSSTSAQLDQLKAEMPKYDDLQKLIIKEFKELERAKIKATFELVGELAGDAGMSIGEWINSLLDPSSTIHDEGSPQPTVDDTPTPPTQPTPTTPINDPNHDVPIVGNPPPESEHEEIPIEVTVTHKSYKEWEQEIIDNKTNYSELEKIINKLHDAKGLTSDEKQDLIDIANHFLPITEGVNIVTTPTTPTPTSPTTFISPWSGHALPLSKKPVQDALWEEYLEITKKHPTWKPSYLGNGYWSISDPSYTRFPYGPTGTEADRFKEVLRLLE